MKNSWFFRGIYWKFIRQENPPKTENSNKLLLHRFPNLKYQKHDKLPKSAKYITGAQHCSIKFYEPIRCIPYMQILIKSL